MLLDRPGLTFYCFYLTHSHVKRDVSVNQGARCGTCFCASYITRLPVEDLHARLCCRGYRLLRGQENLDPGNVLSIRDKNGKQRGNGNFQHLQVRFPRR